VTLKAVEVAACMMEGWRLIDSERQICVVIVSRAVARRFKAVVCVRMLMLQSSYGTLWTR
jgi:hypothetical protein